MQHRSAHPGPRHIGPIVDALMIKLKKMRDEAKAKKERTK